ncbi:MULTISPECIES: hypothetical protein [Paenibacillus]|uniref:hypothetical protein n=1 Tax=Paenibacillus TaxID=44249 RepID=UPI0006D009DC|nr:MULTISPECIES: hypothetical protein [Paenibacillus]GCL74850.1 hypothetical protein PN4B1_48320 [Paenibacillus naphthalenovorans]
MKRGKGPGHRNFTPDEQELTFIEVLEGQGTLEEKAARMAQRLGNRSYSNMLVRMRDIEANIRTDTLAAGGDVTESRSEQNSQDSHSQDTLSMEELILQKLRETFDRNGNISIDSDSISNVWVMLAAVVPLPTDRSPFASLPNIRSSKTENPTHLARVVLRTTDAVQGTNPYVDGTDFSFIVNESRQTADFLWEGGPFSEAPAFNGGDVPSAIEWVKSFATPLYVQFKDPFLTPEQRIALNGHDEDYKLPDSQGKQKPSAPDPDDFDKYF